MEKIVLVYFIMFKRVNALISFRSFCTTCIVFFKRDLTASNYFLDHVLIVFKKKLSSFCAVIQLAGVVG